MLLTNSSWNGPSNLLTAIMIAGKIKFNLLFLTITLNLCHAQSQCNIIETWQLEDTRGTSTASSPMSAANSPSCPLMCSQRAECFATTYNATAGICELHEAYEDGASCMPLSINFGSSFSIMKEPGIPCPEVRWQKQLSVCIGFPNQWVMI